MRHCQVLGGHTVLRLKLRPDTTQTYEHILIEDLTVNPSGRLISASPWNQYADLQGQPQSHSQIRDVTIRHVRGQAKEFGSLINNATSSIKGVRLEDIDVQSDLCAFKVDNHVSGLKFEHVLVNGKPPGIDTSKN
jgi:hypothetical protein